MPNPVGRPSKYTPEIGEKILSIMEQGLSLTAAAADCNISRETVYAWEKEYPEFSDNIKLGRAKRQNFLEKRLMNEETGPKVTSTIFALKNAAPEDWREKVELSGDKENPINTVVTVKIVRPTD